MEIANMLKKGWLRQQVAEKAAKKATESHSIFIKEVGDSTAETIETPLLAVLAVSTPPAFVKTHVPDVPATAVPETAQEEQAAAAAAAAINRAKAWLCPIYEAREARFIGKGLAKPDARALATKLMTRDRDFDDRRACLECQHLGGYGREGWRCGNWQAAGVGYRPQTNQIAPAFAIQLQRCNGFSEQYQAGISEPVKK